MCDQWEDEDDYPPWEDECDHENAEVDILTGAMNCRCGYRRYLSGDELRREAQLQADMAEDYYLECLREEQDARAAIDTTGISP